MTSEIKIITQSQLEIDQIKFNKLYKTSNGITKSNADYMGDVLLLQGPIMTMGSDIIKITKNTDNNSYYYMDILFNNNSVKNKQFMEILNDIDIIVIDYISKNSKLWYGDQSDISCLTQIESEFIPTVKNSSAHYGACGIKIKVKCDDIEFYNVHRKITDHKTIKESCSVVPLFKLIGIHHESDHIWVEWQLVQLKMDISEQYIDKTQPIPKCYLDDSETDEENCDKSDNDFY
jgi:hypothetical protein